MTPNTKPEVHSVSQHRQTRTAATGNMHKNYMQIGQVVPDYGHMLVNRQTHTHADRQTHRQTGSSQYPARLVTVE